MGDAEEFGETLLELCIESARRQPTIQRRVDHVPNFGPTDHLSARRNGCMARVETELALVNCLAVCSREQLHRGAENTIERLRVEPSRARDARPRRHGDPVE